jgi:hypothetical protein
LKEETKWKNLNLYVFIVVNLFPSGKAPEAIAGIAMS